MDAQRFSIEGRNLSVDDPLLQDSLAPVHDTPERPRCPCVAGGIQMYVRRLRHSCSSARNSTGGPRRSRASAVRACSTNLTASAGDTYRLGDGTALSADGLFGSGLRKGFANTEHVPSYTSFDVAAAKSFDFEKSVGKLDVRVMRRTLYLGVTKQF